MEFIEGGTVVELSNPGVISRQLLWPRNSLSERLTITEVHVQTGTSQPRHTHSSSEQIWYALAGSGTLLLADGDERVFVRGDVARFAEGDVHGLRNDSGEEFVYLSVTAPPINFSAAYRSRS